MNHEYFWLYSLKRVRFAIRRRKNLQFPPALMYTLHLLQVPTLQVISHKVLSQLLKIFSEVSPLL